MPLQLLQLLLKASQDKRFVCEEAEKALVAMTTWISPNPMLQKLQPYVTHFNPRVRAKASMCVYNSVSRLVRTFLALFPRFTLIAQPRVVCNCLHACLFTVYINQLGEICSFSG